MTIFYTAGKDFEFQVMSRKILVADLRKINTIGK